MIKSNRLLVGITLLLLSSCVTKKQQTFNFGGGGDYAVNEVVISTPEDKTETLESIESDTFPKTIHSTKEKTISKKGLAHRIAQKKVTKLVKNRLTKNEIAKVNSQNLSKKEAPKKKPGKNKGKWWEGFLFQILWLFGVVLVGLLIILLIWPANFLKIP